MLRMPVSQEARAELIRCLDLLALGVEFGKDEHGRKLAERFTTSLSRLMHMLGVEPFEAENNSQ